MMDFDRTEKLYHYTNFEAACKNIASKTLLMSQLKKMNDVNESQRSVYSTSEGSFFTWKDVSADYHQCSFAVDGADVPGYLLLPMWGHYADKGKSVCLVFDKEKLLGKLDSTKVWHRAVEYAKNYNPEIFISQKDDVLKNYRKIFFKKDAQWMHEQEYRVVSHDAEVDKIHFGDSLKWVVFFSHLADDSIENSAEFRAIKALLGGDEAKMLVYGSNILGTGLVDCSTKTNVTARFK